MERSRITGKVMWSADTGWTDSGPTITRQAVRTAEAEELRRIINSISGAYVAAATRLAG